MKNYFEALQLVKSTFLDGSEKRMVIDYITEHFRVGPLRILDVGIGDGRYIGKVVSELDRAGITATITGVDPSSAAAKAVSKFYPAFTLVSEGFEDYGTNEMFDIVIATHSLYYVNQVSQCFQKMIRLTKKGGLTILVLWSEQCVLYRLYHLYKERCKFSGGNGFITVEQALVHFEHMKARADINSVERVYFPGRVVLSNWRSMPLILDSACMIFSREAGLQKVKKEHIEALRGVLNQFDDIEQRINGIIFVHK